MALRVRKLARELNGSSGEVLGLLHELGLERFRSPEDMLSDAIAERVRRAWSKGLRGAPLAVAEEPAPRTAPEHAPAHDLMARLVPGVVPKGARMPRKKAPAPPVDAPLEAIAAPPAGVSAVETLRAELVAALERERAAFEASRAALAGELARERAAIAAEREAVEIERQRLSEQVRVLEEANLALQRGRGELAQVAADLDARVAPPLIDVLTERGLRGADEFERALGGMANLRALRDVLPLLQVRDREAMRDALRRSLLLVGGEVPDLLPGDVVGVRVAEERGEIPGWTELRRELGRGAEALMLNGLRHVVLVGVPATWQRLVREAFDPRIDLRFVAMAPRPGGDERIDAIVSWDAVGPPTDLDSRPIQVRTRVNGGGLVAFARSLRDALTPTD